MRSSIQLTPSAGPANRSSHLAWACIASGLLLLSFLEVALAHKDVSRLVLATLFGVPAAWCLVRAVKATAKKLGSIDLFSPLVGFPLLYVFWFGCASIALLDDPDPLPFAYFAIGLLCYLGGVVLGRSRVPKMTSANTTAEDPWIPEFFWNAIAALGLLSAVSYAYLISQMGIPILSSDVGELRGELGSYGFGRVIFLSSAWTIFILVALQLSKQSKNQRHKILSIVLLVVTAAALLSFGNRGFLIVPALTVIAARQYIGRILKLRTLAFVAIPAFVTASLYGYARDALLTQGSVSVDDDDPAAIALPFVYAGLYMRISVESFRDVTQVIPEKVPFQHGALSLGALTQVLPGHHESSDLYFKRILGSDFIGGGQPATVLGPLYGDFGVTGIAVGMFLFGLLCGRIYSWMLRRRTICRAAIYGWVAQTALVGILGFFFTYIVTLWIPVFWLCLDHFVRRGGILDVDPRAGAA